MLGFFETAIWLVAVSQLFASIGNVWTMLGYCLGYAERTFLGIWLEGRFAKNQVEVRAVSFDRGSQIAQAMRTLGALVMEPKGSSGKREVDVVAATLPRNELRYLLEVIQNTDDAASITIEDLRLTAAGNVAR